MQRAVIVIEFTDEEFAIVEKGMLEQKKSEDDILLDCLKMGIQRLQEAQNGKAKEEISYEEAVNQVKAKFEEVMQKLIRQDKKKAIYQIEEEIKKMKCNFTASSFNQGICKGLEIAQIVLSEE